MSQDVAGTPPDKDGNFVTVHFKHLGELENANFKVDPNDTLQVIWDLAYGELEIDRDERDVLQAKGKPNPTDLMPYLTLTLVEAQAKGYCDTHFEIAARTGGA